MAIKPEFTRSSSRLPHMIGLHSALRDQHVSPLLQRISKQKFQFSGFIPARGKPGTIIPFYPEFWPIKRRRQTRHFLKRRWLMA